MSLKRLVFDGEDIRYRTGKHWIVFLKALAFLLLAFLVWSSKELLLSLLQFKAPEEIEQFVPVVVNGAVMTFRYAFFVIFTVLALIRLFSFFTLQVALTNKRVLCDDAVFGSFSIDLGKIESVKSEPGIFGGLFGYGKIILTGASSQRVVITNLSRPHVFEKELFAAK